MKAMTGAENLTGLNNDRDIMKATATMVDGLTAVSSEMVSFAQNSWRNSLATAEEMRRCQSARDLVELQLRHARQSYEDYLDQTRKIGEMMTRISFEAVNAVTPPSR